MKNRLCKNEKKFDVDRCSQNYFKNSVVLFFGECIKMRVYSYETGSSLEDEMYSDFCRKKNISEISLCIRLLKSNPRGRNTIYLCPLYFLPEFVKERVLNFLVLKDLLMLASTCKRIRDFILVHIQKRYGISLHIEYPLATIPHSHQISGLLWMRNIEEKKENKDNMQGGILRLTMGLGKTYICLLLCLLFSSKSNLIVVTKTMMSEWYSEILTHFGYYSQGEKRTDVNVLFFHPTFLRKRFSNFPKKEFEEYKIIITTYDVLSEECKKRGWLSRVLIKNERDQVVSYKRATSNYLKNKEVSGPSLLFNTLFERVIADESHIFRNPKTAKFRSIMSTVSKYSWCVTGTPVCNEGLDLWSQLKFCGYAPYPYGKDMSPKDWTCKNADSVSSFIHNLSYKDVGIKLPKKIKIEVFLELSSIEKEVYTFFEKQTRGEYNRFIMRETDYASIWALFTALRQCSTAAYLLCNESKRDFKEDKKEKLLISQLSLLDIRLFNWIKNKKGTAGIKSAKIMKIVEIVKKIPKNEKCVIFSMFVSCLDLIEEAIKLSGISDVEIARLDGTVKGVKREKEILRFKTKVGTRILLSTYTCGYVGLNLMCANHVVCVEPWWTFAVEKQAVSRTHRYGQTKPVYVYRIFIQDSIETRMVRHISKEKKELSKNILTKKIDVPKKLTAYDTGKIIGVYNEEE